MHDTRCDQLEFVRVERVWIAYQARQLTGGTIVSEISTYDETLDAVCPG